MSAAEELLPLRASLDSKERLAFTGELNGVGASNSENSSVQRKEKFDNVCIGGEGNRNVDHLLEHRAGQNERCLGNFFETSHEVALEADVQGRACDETSCDQHPVELFPNAQLRARWTGARQMDTLNVDSIANGNGLVCHNICGENGNHCAEIQVGTSRAGSRCSSSSSSSSEHSLVYHGQPVRRIDAFLSSADSSAPTNPSSSQDGAVAACPPHQTQFSVRRSQRVIHPAPSLDNATSSTLVDLSGGFAKCPADTGYQSPSHSERDHGRFNGGLSAEVVGLRSQKGDGCIDRELEPLGRRFSEGQKACKGTLQFEWAGDSPCEIRDKESAFRLPDGWKCRISRKWGRMFYYHPATGKTSWNFPKEDIPSTLC
mmetsp:Transcript_80212/g.214892  ORF Transcript_80212/g.214892 Transcript_80212/m.214892 type:complete len:373 (+) Transcript_80212:763-1881(+)